MLIGESGWLNECLWILTYREGWKRNTESGHWTCKSMNTCVNTCFGKKSKSAGLYGSRHSHSSLPFSSPFLSLVSPLLSLDHPSLVAAAAIQQSCQSGLSSLADFPCFHVLLSLFMPFPCPFSILPCSQFHVSPSQLCQSTTVSFFPFSPTFSYWLPQGLCLKAGRESGNGENGMRQGTTKWAAPLSFVPCLSKKDPFRALPPLSHSSPIWRLLSMTQIQEKNWNFAEKSKESCRDMCINWRRRGIPNNTKSQNHRTTNLKMNKSNSLISFCMVRFILRMRRRRWHETRTGFE